jgi:hypothetical protein
VKCRSGGSSRTDEILIARRVCEPPETIAEPLESGGLSCGCHQSGRESFPSAKRGRCDDGLGVTRIN